MVLDVGGSNPLTHPIVQADNLHVWLEVQAFSNRLVRISVSTPRDVNHAVC